MTKPSTFSTARFDLIGIDGDDTLWHDMGNYLLSEEKFEAIVAKYSHAKNLSERLMETERKNLQIFGFGVKGYTLSLIETAIEVSEGRIDAAGIQQILDLGRAMMQAPVDVMDGVVQTLEILRPNFKLIVITKGDLFHQESKFARSNLSGFFDAIEVVSQKDVTIYNDVMDKYGVQPENFLMIGNSLKSDILPVLKLGGWGIHIPYHTEWELDRAEADISGMSRAAKLESFADLADFLLE